MRMQRALEMYIVEGIHTTIPLHRRILADPEFQAGNIDTKYVERLLARMQQQRAEEAVTTA
jgi:acetyl-CoA carboxylase biotin carboxylase subunit